jgi:short subunit dehydrogenase-like uncharacterized protein
MPTDTHWILYGANGYTGELIAEAAVARGERPIIAGRRADAIIPIAERLGLEHRVFDLDTPERIAANLDDVDAMLLCAGPFSRTSAPVVQACLDSGTHYLDITGEIGVFEACHARNADAVAADCVVMPGVGFDVVPSDCLAASLAAALPGATSLELAFHGVGSPSKGTAKTMVEGIPHGGAIRRNGRIEEVPLAWKTYDVPFRDRTRTAVTIPWGDVSTAFYSTGIPDICVYMASPPNMIRGMKLARPFRKILGAAPVQKLMKKAIDARVEGPDEDARASGYSQLWGRVTKGDESIEGTLVTPEGYRLTVMTALESVVRVARGEVEPGARTPSMAFGAGYIEAFEDCDLQIG